MDVEIIVSDRHKRKPRLNIQPGFLFVDLEILTIWLQNVVHSC